MLAGAYVRILRGFTHPGSPRAVTSHGGPPLAHYAYMVTLVCPALILRRSWIALSLFLLLFLSFSLSHFLIQLVSRSFLRVFSRSLDGNSSLDTICPLSSCRSQGVPSPRARDIPPHENLIANPPETPANPSPRVDVDCPRAVRCSQARKRQR